MIPNASENVLRWERTVQDGDDELEASRQAEIKQRSDIDREMQRAESLKAERQVKRHQVEQMEDEMGKVSKAYSLSTSILIFN